MKPISTLTFSPLHPTHPHLGAATALYETAFPEAERRDTALWLDLMTTSRQFHALAIMTGEAFAGLITWWQLTDDFCYVEHFAIAPSLRSAGIGGVALEQFVNERKGYVVLEVEPPTDEMPRRRIGFYSRHGFSLWSLPYRQPPYRSGGDWLDLCLMSTAKEPTQDVANRLVKTLHQSVYGLEC